MIFLALTIFLILSLSFITTLGDMGTAASFISGKAGAKRWLKVSLHILKMDVLSLYSSEKKKVHFGHGLLYFFVIFQIYFSVYILNQGPFELHSSEVLYYGGSSLGINLFGTLAILALNDPKNSFVKSFVRRLLLIIGVFTVISTLDLLKFQYGVYDRGLVYLSFLYLLFLGEFEYQTKHVRIDDGLFYQSLGRLSSIHFSLITFSIFSNFVLGLDLLSRILSFLFFYFTIRFFVKRVQRFFPFDDGNNTSIRLFIYSVMVFLLIFIIRIFLWQF